jgi:hypothetical protein
MFRKMRPDDIPEDIHARLMKVVQSKMTAGKAGKV